MKADRGVETGSSSYRLHSGDICDFYETFENISARFIAQIQSSFFPHISRFVQNAGRRWLCLPCL